MPGHRPPTTTTRCGRLSGPRPPVVGQRPALAGGDFRSGGAGTQLAGRTRRSVVSGVQPASSNVSQLARELGISRALLQVHLRKLESAGLVSSTLELSEDGKAMKYYEVVPFALNLTPGSLIALAETITIATDEEAGQAQGES
ncbi:transcriptional regulator [Streptomyces venezuelae]|uniref:Transcriptional regulator n=1 Tax=Streptomyces venezuelae TaxID=54571 RepID=A0A5P2CYP8_STRVZ|nr:winged helix-turn-helix domain-containing protein [Streptomyces venezuelae]QES47097.1 transcriptional regulator [Streptomyces venezuelae]